MYVYWGYGQFAVRRFADGWFAVMDNLPTRRFADTTRRFVLNILIVYQLYTDSDTSLHSHIIKAQYGHIDIFHNRIPGQIVPR